ncbi:hypothetical protein AK812_SmicGene21242 [Symbiodinium microadriaticum]|uniref:Uncharacterized protein n=1 Tax=Symbiodinium microadriaticum TaxID=2951 RepID=A0A1Q9DMW6_SYMMI|nr:hypothetical protein AK812_SmicGene21242 [Symbiodinium microadriaticum]
MASEVECTIDGMASIWDACPQIRERLRAGHPLISEVSDKCVDVKTPSTYHFVLEPLLEKMKDANKKLPSVDALRVEIAEVLTNNNRQHEATDPEVPEFQQLCLTLEPSLQATVDMVNANRAARAAAAEVDDEDEDAYELQGAEDLSALLNQFSSAASAEVDSGASGSTEPPEREPAPSNAVPDPDLFETPIFAPIRIDLASPEPVPDPPAEATELPPEATLATGPTEALPDPSSTATRPTEPLPELSSSSKPPEPMPRPSTTKVTFQADAADGSPRVGREPAAMDTDETQPVDINTCKSPPPSTKRKPSPEASVSDMRADYKRTREARVKTEPRLPYNPYTPEASHPKARSSDEDFTPDEKVQSIHSMTPCRLNKKTKDPKAPSARGRGRGGRGRGRKSQDPGVEDAGVEGELKASLICGYTEEEWGAWYDSWELSEEQGDVEKATNEKQEPEMSEGDKSTAKPSAKKNPKVKKDPKPTPKAKAKSKSGKAAADKLDDADGTTAKREIFAGRRKPEKHEFNMARFDAIRCAFKTYVREEVSRPSMYEGPFWTFCMDHMEKAEGPITIDNINTTVDAIGRKYKKQVIDVNKIKP